MVTKAHLWNRRSQVRIQDRPAGDCKTLSVNQTVTGFLFQIREGIGSERRGVTSAFHMMCPGYSGPLGHTTLNFTHFVLSNSSSHTLTSYSADVSFVKMNR